MAIVAMFVVTPEVHPDNGGGYQAGSFRELLHHEITMPNLDKGWAHTLIDVEVAPDRASARLTIHSTPDPAVNLDHGFSVVTWQPKAHVRAHDQGGNVLAEVKLDAPLHAGQPVVAGGDHYRVAADITYPNRDPASGACPRGALDWQHVTLHPDPPAPHQPTAAQE